MGRGGTVSNNTPVGNAGQPAKADGSAGFFGRGKKSEARSAAIERRLARMNGKKKSQ